MQAGKIEAIFIGQEKSAPLQSVPSAYAIPGKGLLGDRHFDASGRAKPENQLTLVEQEILHALERELAITLPAADLRRNVLTSGIRLSELVGREFQLGDIRVRGIMLCEPCYHIACLAERDILKPMVHRGGLRAQILSEGTLRVGGIVQLVENIPSISAV